MCCESEYGASVQEIDIVPLSGTPSGVFWYNPEKLLECLKALGGTMMLKVATNGALLMETDELTCLQGPMREPKPVERVAFKPRKPEKSKETSAEKKETGKKPKEAKKGESPRVQKRRPPRKPRRHSPRR